MEKKYPILYDKYSNRLLCYHLNTEIIDTEIYEKFYYYNC